MTKEEARDIFREASAACIRLYQDKVNRTNRVNEAAKDLEQKLGDIWGSLCELYEEKYPLWHADQSHKGYLCRTVNEKEVKVPYHLVDDFPLGDTLNELCQLAIKVKTADNGVVCISGSTTFLRSLEYVADIDYCEYVPVDKSTSWHVAFVNTLEAATSRFSNDLAWLRGKVEVFDDNGVITTLKLGENALQITANIGRGKLDFVAQFMGEIVKATNVILPVDKDQADDSNLGLSFPLQEAPITDGSWVPQKLLEPISLGAYATWLSKEVKDYQDSEPIKAAKRALSLARLTGFPEEADQVIDILTKHGAPLKATLDARQALKAKFLNMQDCDENVMRDLSQKLDKTINKLSNAYSRYNDAATNCSDQLKQVMTELCEALQREIAIASNAP